MQSTAAAARIPSARAELAALLVLAWVAFGAIPIALGGIGLGWDALNHHIYLGWIADRPRFDKDFMAASGQSFQYPYLYWPVYKLFASGMDGKWAGAVLASLNLIAVPPVWMLARLSVPDGNWYGIAMRWLAVALAFSTAVVLSLFDSTSNDLLAAVPLVWAVALAMETGSPAAPGRRSWLLIFLSGLCAAASVAFKLSNGPLVLLMPLLWALQGHVLRERARYVAVGCLGVLGGVAVFYGAWGWQLWVHYGNPIYPFCDSWFALVRDWTGWQP